MILKEKTGTSTVQSVVKGTENAPAPTLPTAGAVAEPTRATKMPAGRDYEGEARGKTRCAAITAALQSPAGQAYAATEKEYVEFILRMADVVVKYTFQDK